MIALLFSFLLVLEGLSAVPSDLAKASLQGIRVDFRRKVFQPLDTCVSESAFTDYQYRKYRVSGDMLTVERCADDACSLNCQSRETYKMTPFGSPVMFPFPETLRLSVGGMQAYRSSEGYFISPEGPPDPLTNSEELGTYAFEAGFCGTFDEATKIFYGPESPWLDPPQGCFQGVGGSLYKGTCHPVPDHNVWWDFYGLADRECLIDGGGGMYFDCMMGGGIDRCGDFDFVSGDGYSREGLMLMETQEIYQNQFESSVGAMQCTIVKKEGNVVNSSRCQPDCVTDCYVEAIGIQSN